MQTAIDEAKNKIGNIFWGAAWRGASYEQILEKINDYLNITDIVDLWSGVDSEHINEETLETLYGDLPATEETFIQQLDNIKRSRISH